MELTPAPSNESTATLQMDGELVVLTGKHKGLTRPLKTPLTFIGSSAACDIRLNTPSINENHALIVFDSQGVVFRDLNSNSGSLINGNRATNVLLHHGDTVTIGPFQFQVRLIEKPESTGGPNWDAVRLQAAAVAAQQVALGEEESRIEQRQGALHLQEAQLASRLEEQREQLAQLHTKTQAERQALEQDRLAYEKYVAGAAGNLTEGQRELMEGRKQLQAERERLLRQQKSLQKQWKRRFDKQELQHALREEHIANDACDLKSEANQLQRQRTKFDHHRLSFFGNYELGRRQLQDAWDKLRHEQTRWHTRRMRERTLLKLKERDLISLEKELGAARDAQQKEHDDRIRQHSLLKQELAGLNQRIKHARLRLRNDTPPIASPAAGAAAEEQPAAIEPDDTTRVEKLDQLASELADQRLQLAEHWERFSLAKTKWEKDRAQAVAALEEKAKELAGKEMLLEERAQAQKHIEQQLRKRHEDLNRQRQYLIGWQARLRSNETAFNGERDRMLAEVREREQTAEATLIRLDELRQQWMERRKQELDQLRSQRANYEEGRKSVVRLREEWKEKIDELHTEKRRLAERTLALEQYRHETILQGQNSPAADRRIERLQHRWTAQNAEEIRRVQDERQSLAEEMAKVNKQQIKLHQEIDAAEKKTSELVAKQSAWEKSQADADMHQAEMKKQFRVWKQKFESADQQIRQWQEEFERLARTLVDEPELPAILKIAA